MTRNGPSSAFAVSPSLRTNRKKEAKMMNMAKKVGTDQRKEVTLV
jgi:hypothetical protein